MTILQRTVNYGYSIPHNARRVWLMLIALRCAIAIGALLACDAVIDLGTSFWFLGFALVVGTAIGSCAAFTRLRTSALVVGALALYATLSATFGALNYLPLPGTSGIFFTYLLSLDVLFAAMCGALALILALLFWRYRHFASFEAICGSLLVIAAVAPHRNFHFNRPTIINSIAWRLGVDELTVFVALGATLFGTLAAYLALVSSPKRPFPGIKPAHVTHVSHPWWRTSAVALFAILCVGFLAKNIYQHFNMLAVSRIANGVGSEGTEGMSPLGFHSALGGTNQPAAVVRLDGDYKENPLSPMLYFREAALSDFNGKEMVLAHRAFDADVSRIAPRERFVGKADTELMSRRPLHFSAYLLADQKLAFAVDYPLAIEPLKNPAPNRFKGAFRGYSMAPAFPVSAEALRDVPVGDSRWDQHTREHYLEPHGDIRYSDLARKLTEQAPSVADKVYAVTTFLTKNAIYTLTPGHTVAADEDPVAPFLFGDMRGYCVHFAHATVYLLRSLGIPSRVATGYLTDLSQARDGHILLRMSDRHAWAEVYFDKHGWIPFDTQPEQVESHAETQVDMKLLEELMQMLGPDETILPESSRADEPGLRDDQDESRWGVPSPVWQGLAVAVIGALVVSKLFVWFGWILPAKPQTRVRRIYRAVVARLIDSGLPRDDGETRLEYQRRIARALGDTEALRITETLNRLRFARDYQPSPDEGTAGIHMRLLRTLPLWRRIVALANPASALRILGGSRW